MSDDTMDMSDVVNGLIDVETNQEKIIELLTQILEKIK